MKSAIHPLSALLLLSSLAACRGDTEPDEEDIDNPTVGPYDVTIRWTEYGVPHLLASDEGSIGYGLGLLTARHHGCTYADQVVKVKGERSRYLGPGPDDAYLNEDFGWKAIDPVGQARRWWPELSDIARARFLGFAAGYNEALRQGEFPSACAAEPWVGEITQLDALAYGVALGLDGSSKVFIREIGSAQPPGSANGNAGGAPSASPVFEPDLRRIVAELKDPARGSNGWAIGSDRSAETGGLLLSNTHFPAWGEKRWYESHLTIPGTLDVYGASLIGVPLINIGFNRHVAWTHTVSYAPRFTAYALTLAEGDPTAYVVDGETRRMTSQEVVVEVLRDEGVVEETRELWRSEHGPILSIPGVGWTEQFAVAVRDVNDGNLGLFDVWEGMNRAESMDELLAEHVEHQGIPWVYTIAASDDGEILFADTSRAPYLTQAQWDAWQEWLGGAGLPQILAGQFYDQAGAIVLPAEDSFFDWTEDLDAVDPGIAPPSVWPQDRRRDYALNANDSHWLHNAEEPLTGQLPIWGPERTPRSGRTIQNARYLSQTGPESASGEDGKFTLEEVEAAALSMRSALADNLLDAFVSRCDGADPVDLGGTSVDLATACDVLQAWSGTYTTEAKGAVLWRETMAAYTQAQDVSPFSYFADGGGLFEQPFDADDPLGTPADVVAPPETGDDPVLVAMATAVQALDAAGIALDATLGSVQRMPFLDGSDQPFPGANYWEGTIGIADWSGGATTTAFDWIDHPGFANGLSERTTDGRYLVNNGNSYIFAVAFTEDGPRARAVSTYSQSTDAESPFLHDQSEVYAAGSLRDVIFDEDAVDEAAVDVERLQREQTEGF